jgi:cysteinyl-tRNA synthetase
LNYSDEQLDEACVALTRLYTALRGVEIADVVLDQAYVERFQQAMDDDFNTPVALSVLFDLARELNKTDDKQVLAATLKSLAALLGLLQDEPDQFLKGGAGDDGISEEQIEQLIEDRKTAKANKDWAQADSIRDQLKAQGVVLEDVAGGNTIWRREN